MSRSGQAATSAAAMDELNLDDLFMDGGDTGDDLFGGLDDIDLDGFDDISSVGGPGAGGAASVASGRSRGRGAASVGGMGAGPADLAFDALPLGVLGRPPSLAPPPMPPALPPSAAGQLAQGSKKSQRKKRKTKKMLLSEEEEEDSDEAFVPGATTKKRKVKGKAKGGRKNKKSVADAGGDDNSSAAKGSTGKASNRGKKSKKGKGSAATTSAAASESQHAGENDASSSPSAPLMPPPLPRIGPGGINIGALPKHLQGSAVFASGATVTRKNTINGKDGGSNTDTTNTSTKGSSSSKAKKRKSAKASSEASAEAPGAASASAIDTDPTHCGLEPNTSMFYPFMPMPAEVTMKRLHKAYPTLDKLHTRLSRISDGGTPGKGGGNSGSTVMNGAGGAGATAATAAVVDSNNPLFRLFVDHLGALDNSHSSSAKKDGETLVNAPEQAELEANVETHLVDARALVSNTKNSRLKSELMKVLLLIKRQETFMNNCLVNMDAWCKQHMSDDDYKEGFLDEVQAETDATSGPILPLVTSVTPVYVKIRVKCKGFRESTSMAAKLGGGPLVAQLPVPPEIAKAAAGSTPTKRRRKSVTSATSASASSSLPFEYLTLSERRRLVARAISTKAFELEAKQKEIKIKSENSRKTSDSKMQQIIKDDPVEVCHTTTLWKIMKHSPFVADISEEDITEGLAEAWQPELESREMYWGEVPPVRIQKNRPVSRKREVEEAGADNVISEKEQALASKLFDRLQSLLVDVGDDQDQDDITSESEDNAGNGNSSDTIGPRALPSDIASTYVSDPRSEASLSALVNTDGKGLLDLSKFTLDQRAYVQLRALGLADVPLLPSTLPIVEEESYVPPKSPPKIAALNAAAAADKSHDAIFNGKNKVEPSSIASDKVTGVSSANNDDLDLIVRRMQNDLSDMHRNNNVRTALLQASATQLLFEQQRGKCRDDEASSLVARHTHLLKKQKEAQIKKAPKPKAVSTGENWLPW